MSRLIGVLDGIERGLTFRVLDNGVRLLYLRKPMGRFPLIASTVLLAGSAMEGACPEGTAHLLEHLLMRRGPGNKFHAGASAHTFADYIQINDFFRLGALPGMLRKLGRLDRKLDASLLRLAKTEVIEDIRRWSEGEPSASLFRRLHSRAFASRGHRRLPIGTVEEVRRIRARHPLEFWARNIDGSRVIVSLISSFPFERVRDLAARALEDLPKRRGRCPARATAVVQPGRFVSGARNPANLIMGFMIPGLAHPSRLGLGLVNGILTGSQSLLRKKFRFEASSLVGVVPDCSGQGLYELVFRLDGSQKISDIESFVLEELGRLAQRGPSGAELWLVKKVMAEGLLGFERLDEVRRAMISLSCWEGLAGSYRIFFELARAIEGADPGHVRRAAALLLRAPMTVVAGPDDPRS